MKTNKANSRNGDFHPEWDFDLVYLDNEYAVYVGGYESALNAEFLVGAGISVIVNMAGGEDKEKFLKKQ